MKITFWIAVILISILIACKSKKKERAEVGTQKIIAIRTYTDSVRRPVILYRTILKTISYDSTKKKDVIVVDTIWQEEFVVVVKDSTGRDTTEKRYIRVPKDSVDWRVENKDVDSMSKKR